MFWEVTKLRRDSVLALLFLSLLFLYGNEIKSTSDGIGMNCRSSSMSNSFEVPILLLRSPQISITGRTVHHNNYRPASPTAVHRDNCRPASPTAVPHAIYKTAIPTAVPPDSLISASPSSKHHHNHISASPSAVHRDNCRPATPIAVSHAIYKNSNTNSCTL